MYRAVVTRTWVNPETSEKVVTIEYAGPYVREGQARASGTRMTRWWQYRKDIEISVEIQQSEQVWTPVEAK
jgi:hypothetical protein